MTRILATIILFTLCFIGLGTGIWLKRRKDLHACSSKFDHEQEVKRAKNMDTQA